MKRMDTRTIFHIDMDAFFASIEIAKNPSLKGKPVVVGGNPDQRGVVSTCTYEARAYGIHSAMPLFEAKKRCPHAIFLEGDYALYRAYAERITSIFQGFTERVEVVSIDEAYMDVSAIVSPFPSATALAEMIREKIKAEVNLTCSIGIASNKLVAKIASGLAKPNGVYEIPYGQEAAFLAPLPIQTLPGVGTKTQQHLNRDGFESIRDIQKVPLDTLFYHYGARGYHLFYESQGQDKRPVISEHQPPKSLGAEITFDRDIDLTPLLLENLERLTVKTHKRLLAHNMRTQGISIKLRYPNFRTITRSASLYTHTNNLITINNEVKKLFMASYGGGTPLRLIGVSLERLTDTYWQPVFWEY